MHIKTTSIPLFLAIVFIFNACSSDLLNRTPKCSDADVVDTLTKLLNADGRKATIDIDMVRQIELNDQNGMRTCQTNVDYVYSVSENNPLMSSFKKALTGSPEGISKFNNLTYTVTLGETGKKFIVSVKE